MATKEQCSVQCVSAALTVVLRCWRCQWDNYFAQDTVVTAYTTAILRIPLKYKRAKWSGNLITQKRHELRKLQYHAILPADLSVLFPKSHCSQSLQSHSTDSPNLGKEKLGLWHLSCLLNLSSIFYRLDLCNDPYQPDLSNFPGPI
jgi:hypothetical protein